MNDDSELVHELVTTKYKIAEKNRIAKYRFLNKAERTKKSAAVIHRRDSEPLTTTMELSNVNSKIDYSVPGTPISSRNIDQLKKIYRNIESDSEDDGNLNEQSVVSISKPPLNSLLLDESLRKFTADMEALQQQATAIHHESCDEAKPFIDTYFVDSDKKNTYRREFSEVAGVIDFGPKPSNIEKVEHYFQESIRLNSFQREFPMETFNPQNNKFYNLSIPGTPISSRFITPMKNEMTHNLIDTESEASNESYDDADDDNHESDDDDDDDDEGGNGESDDNLSIVTMKNSLEEISCIDAIDDNIIISEKETIIESTTTESTKSVCEIIVNDEKGVKLNITVPGTPVSSRRVSTISTGTCSLADDFSSIDDYNVQIAKLANECVNVIEDLLQKVLQDEEKKSPEVLNIIKAGNEDQHLDESLETEHDDDDVGVIKTTTDVVNKTVSTSTLTEQNIEATLNNETTTVATSLDLLLNIESSENIQRYLEKSSMENSYQRTFSEVEKFNEPLPGAKHKINKYFEESEQKMTFQRPFSEVFSYLVNVEPNIKNNDLTIPGTPISSQKIMSLKHDQVQCNEQQEQTKIEPFSVDDYFKESDNRNTFQRSFSETVDKMGMPIVNSNNHNNSDVNNYFKLSDQQKSYQRQFSDAIQEMPSRIEDILLDKKQQQKVTNGNVNKQRASSVCSNQSNKSIDENQLSSKIYGKNYGIDKYFATSLYRTAYHRSAASRRESTDDNDDDELGADNSLNIFEDERVFDALKQSNNQTKVRHCSENINNNTQHTQFWKDFMKPSI